MDDIPAYATCYMDDYTKSCNSQQRKPDKIYFSSVMNNYESLQTKYKQQENCYADINGTVSNTCSSKISKSDTRMHMVYECLQSKEKQDHSVTYDTIGHAKTDFSEKDVVKRRKRPCLVFCCVAFVALIIGAVLSGLALFLLMKFNQSTSKSLNNITPESNALNEACVWSSWSHWTECYSPCLNGLQLRMKQKINTSGKCDSRSLVEKRSCSTFRCQGEELDMKFNSSTLHSSRYMSNDNTVLSNQQTGMKSKTFKTSTGFKNYAGVMADMCFKEKERIYYEVEYEFMITTRLTYTNLILEVGLAQRNQIDSRDFVGNIAKGWSFVLARCGDSDNICLRAKHNRHLDTNRVFSENKERIDKKGTFGVFIDRIKNQFSLIIHSTNVVISFTNVNSKFELCPVFGVHHKEKVDVKLKLMKTQNMTDIPCNLMSFNPTSRNDFLLT